MRGRRADGAVDIMKKLLFSAEGRIGRATFWKGILGSVLGAIIVASALNYVLAQMIPNEAAAGEGFKVDGPAAIPFVILNLLTTVFIVWSSVCLGIKRYHDRDKPGVWVLLSLIPLGNLWYFIETGFLRGTVGPNTFGPDPRGRGLATSAGLSLAI